MLNQKVFLHLQYRKKIITIKAKDMKTEEYSVVVKIGSNEHVVADELFELSDAQEVFDDFMNDNDNGDVDKELLNDGGEVLIKCGDKVLKKRICLCLLHYCKRLRYGRPA